MVHYQCINNRSDCIVLTEDFILVEMFSNSFSFFFFDYFLCLFPDNFELFLYRVIIFIRQPSLLKILILVIKLLTCIVLKPIWSNGQCLCFVYKLLCFFINRFECFLLGLVSFISQIFLSGSISLIYCLYNNFVGPWIDSPRFVFVFLFIFGILSPEFLNLFHMVFKFFSSFGSLF
uniref:Uncharacterized protein n=1 Tax=Cacopsylla melanoneura TaxID=428564 RepID=A0A8D9F2B0_9HEMI